MEKFKVSTLSSPIGFMVICEIDEWADAMRSLIKKANKKGIMPSALVITRFNEGSGTPRLDITLWGER